MIRDLALEAWKRVDSEADYIGSYAKVVQGATEPYADFLFFS